MTEIKHRLNPVARKLLEAVEELHKGATILSNWSNPDWLISDPHILDGMIEKDIRAVIDAKEELRRRYEIELVKGYQSDD